MVNEIYVSIEIAKMLCNKLLGFNGEWHKHYWGYEPGREFLTSDLYNPDYDYPAPTHQVVLAWLRREKHIVISIQADIISGAYFRYKANIMDMNTHEDICPEKISAPTYESATEKAILFVLTKLKG